MAQHGCSGGLQGILSMFKAAFGWKNVATDGTHYQCKDMSGTVKVTRIIINYRFDRTVSAKYKNHLRKE